MNRFKNQPDLINALLNTPETYLKLIQKRHYIGWSKNKNLNIYSIDDLGIYDVMVLSLRLNQFS